MELIDLHNPVLWLILGIVLIGAEILLPSMIALGFGVAGLVVAGLLYLLPMENTGAPVLLVVWAVLSAVTWVLMRFAFKNKNVDDDPYDGDINEY